MDVIGSVGGNGNDISVGSKMCYSKTPNPQRNEISAWGLGRLHSNTFYF